MGGGRITIVGGTIGEMSVFYGFGICLVKGGILGAITEEILISDFPDVNANRRIEECPCL